MAMRVTSGPLARFARWLRKTYARVLLPGSSLLSWHPGCWARTAVTPTHAPCVSPASCGFWTIAPASQRPHPPYRATWKHDNRPARVGGQVESQRVDNLHGQARAIEASFCSDPVEEVRRHTVAPCSDRGRRLGGFVGQPSHRQVQFVATGCGAVRGHRGDRVEAEDFGRHDLADACGPHGSAFQSRRESKPADARKSSRSHSSH
jgi:hypothetical protein